MVREPGARCSGVGSVPGAWRRDSCETWQGYRVTGHSRVSQMWPCLNWVLKKTPTELAKGKNRRVDKHSRERTLCTNSQRQETKTVSGPVAGGQGATAGRISLAPGALETRGAEVDSPVAQRQERPLDIPSVPRVNQNN